MALIPRQVLFADPEKMAVKISLDGQMLSYLAPVQGSLNLMLAPLSHLEQAKCVTKSEEPLRDYVWLPKSDYILYWHDCGGDENWQLKGYHLPTATTITYTPPKTHARILRLSQKHPHQILITLNQRQPSLFDVYKLDLEKNTLTLVYENEGYWDFLADSDLTVRFALKVEETGGAWVDLAPHAEKRRVAEISQHDLLGFFLYASLRPRFSESQQTLYLPQSLHRNTSHLAAVTVETEEVTFLGGSEKADICDVLYCPKTQQPIAFAVNPARKIWVGLEEKWKAAFAFLSGLAKGDIDIVSQSENNDKWIVAFVQDTGPIQYYCYYPKLSKATFLFPSIKAFLAYAFNKMTPYDIPMRDGIHCMSYLTLPQNKVKPVPLVLMVHGGPNYRDFWGFNPVHQWLSDRRYAVLSVNYRASTGFGKAHMAAGKAEWGGKIQQDLLEAVDWAIEKGITSKEQVAIMGRSFGGYAVLVGLTQTPEKFCCGVDIVGPANLETMAKRFPPYWQAMQGTIHEILGCDPNTDDGKAYLKARSPLYQADKIRKPLLIGHGANDVRVHQEESDEMVAKMQANQIPVTYVVFPDEGHQFLHPNNRIAFYTLAEAFLAKHLGGLFEPEQTDLETSMQIKSSG